MKKAFLIVILIVFGSKIAYSLDYFTIEQKESNLPIKIGADTITNEIYGISFPLIFDVTYHACDTMQFYNVEYLTNPLYDGSSYHSWVSIGFINNYDNGDPVFLKTRIIL